jgi:hypothetical protein
MQRLTTSEAMARLGVTKAMVHKLLRGNSARKGWAARGAELERFHGFRVWTIPAHLVDEYEAERG